MVGMAKKPGTSKPSKDSKGSAGKQTYKDPNAAVKGAKKRGEKSVTFNFAKGGMVKGKKC